MGKIAQKYKPSNNNLDFRGFQVFYKPKN